MRFPQEHIGILLTDGHFSDMRVLRASGHLVISGHVIAGIVAKRAFNNKRAFSDKRAF